MINVEEWIVESDDLVAIPYEMFKSWVAYDEQLRMDELASIGLVPDGK